MRSNRNHITGKVKSTIDHGSIIITVFLLFNYNCGISLAGTEITSDNHDENKDICKNEECTKFADMIKDNMDCTVDPCDDFFRYACGGYIKRTVLPVDIPGEDYLLNTENTVYSQCKEVLENNDEATSSLRYVKQAKSLYNQCMDTTASNTNRLEPLQKLLKKFGGWPLPEVDPPADLDWFQTYSDLHKAGFLDYLIELFIFPDPKNHTRYLINIDQPKLSLPSVYLSEGLTHKLVQDYYKFLVKCATLLGADESFASRVLNDSLHFEIQLANILVGPSGPFNPEDHYNLKKVSELPQYPHLRFEECLKKILLSRISITDEDIINLDSRDYFPKLEDLLKKTPGRVIINYLLSRVVKEVAPYMNDAMREAEFEFSSKLTGSTIRRPKWHECVALVQERFGIALGAMYIKRYYNDETKAEVVRMVADLKKELTKRVQLVDWMDERTRALALKKIDVMSVQIGYPEELRDNTKVEEYYKDMQSSAVYLESVFNTSVFKRNKMIDVFRKPVVKNDWTEFAAAATVQAYYNPLNNAIWFPAAFLQKRMFQHDRPRFTNYGGLGAVIAHELTHGFDNIGRLFDENGKLLDWFDQTTFENFNERAQCIHDQYNKYTIQQIGVNVDGERTLRENIADNGGARIAFNAYISYLNEHPEENKKKLPGIEMTSRQVFWLSFANLWCSKYKDVYLQYQMNVETHSPSEYRINGPFSNMPEFSEDFHCLPTSKMNTANKCVLW